ncbi:MAG: Ig-like domain-containing protein, partial [Thermoplasmatales archaeon]|nr:Ig-like domain-containing protein [Thermoplasmatales archaeon]
PSEGSYVVLNAIATITGNANDNTDAGTVQKVEVKIDREAWQTATGTTSWSFNWDTTGWNPGPHKIFARAYDDTDYSEVWVCRNVEIIVDPTLPDLTLSSADITFSNPSPNEGDLVTINATVYNVNTGPDAQNATGVEIGFYDGNPSVGGTLIGIVPATPSLIEPGNSGWGEVTWDTNGLAGWHDIYVVADPNHTVAELTDSNNIAIKTIPVAGYGIALSCSANSSTIQAGGSANYEIVVRNTGTDTDSFDLTIDNPTSWNANFNDNPPAGKGVKGGKVTKAEYYNYTTATNELQNTAANYPSITKLYSIGKSCENRDIWAMKVSDNVAVNETDEPDILYMGMHHAREWMTVEVPIYFLNYLVNNYGTDSEVTWLVNNRELWIIP